jgi:hypothetical protein
MSLSSTLAAACLAATCLVLTGCGAGGAFLEVVGGSGALEVENDELSTTYINEIWLDLEEIDWDDPWWDTGWESAESLRNRDPNEMETFHDLRPGWWRVEVVWGDGEITVEHDVHVNGWETTNLEVRH